MPTPEPHIEMVDTTPVNIERLLVTLVTGSSAASRESALAAVLATSHDQPVRIALILEGLPDGSQQTAMLLDPAQSIPPSCRQRGLLPAVFAVSAT